MSERADNLPPEAVVNPQRNGHLPRWARVPASILAFVGFGAVDQITSFVPTVVAAGPKCTGTVEVLGFKYADRFDIDGTGRKDIIDPTDYDLGDADFHGVNLLNKDKKPFDPPKKENMISKGNYSRATFPITPKDNLDCTTADSLELYVQFEREEKVLYRVILPNRQKIFHVGGKKETDKGALERIASGSRLVQQVGTSTEQIAKVLTGHTLGLVSAEDMKADNSDQNKKAIKDYVGKTKTASTPPQEAGVFPVVPVAAGAGLLSLLGAGLAWRRFHP